MMQDGPNITANADRSLEIDLNAPVHLSDLPLVLRSFWRWWLAQLLALLPARLQRALPRAAPLTQVHVEPDGWTFMSPDQAQPGLKIDPGLADKDLAAQILAAAPSFSLAPVVVVVPAARALRRQVELPLMHERQVQAAVSLQVDRLTPFAAGSVWLGVRVVTRDAVEGRLVANSVFVPRGVVEPVAQRLVRLGFAVERTDVAGDDGKPLGFRLVDPAEAPATRRIPRGTILMAMLAAGSWWLAGTMLERARVQEIEAWQSRIEALRPLAARSIALRARLEGLAAPAALAARHRPDAVLSVLRELDRVLPDTAHLATLEVEGQGLRMTGIAGDAAQLIPRLEASPVLREVKFVSQVMRVTERNADRFEIGARLEEAVP
jgi:general secretion pathway protein L